MNRTEEPLSLAMDGMIRTDRRHHALCDRNLSCLGLHRSQHRMLHYLFRAGEPVTQSSLAKNLDVSPAVVTVTVKTLEAGGYILRDASGTDRRATMISLSEKGKETVDLARGILMKIDRGMFAGFTDAELETLADFYRRMQDNLSREEKEIDKME